MERPDLLIAFLAFGAAVCTLMAWMWASVTRQGPSSAPAAQASGDRGRPQPTKRP